MQVSSSFDQMVTATVPSLSRSLAEQFNVFRVMHHGTHEKQLSNVFAWLLRPDGSHELGDAFQRLFVEQVNQGLPAASQLSISGWRVVQEVDTSGHDELGRDIADIVLTSAHASVVIENFESSDGHGHCYHRYLAYGASGGKQSVVVLLCARRESHRQTKGWQQAVVVTYADIVEALEKQVAGDKAWQKLHPQQNFFINEVVRHFMEVPGAVNSQDRIAFIQAMCETGESARYGHRPQAIAAQEFADLLAQHAMRQFEEGRKTLGELKQALKRYVVQSLVGQVNDALAGEPVVSVQARFVGQWEWAVSLEREDPAASVYLEFGPTAVVENGRVPVPVVDPDYTKVFVVRQGVDSDSIDLMVPTDVGLEEVLTGLSADDTRLRDAVLAVIGLP